MDTAKTHTCLPAPVPLLPSRIQPIHVHSSLAILPAAIARTRSIAVSTSLLSVAALKAADTDVIVCKQGHINLATSANADILLFYLGWVFRVPLLPQVCVCVCGCVCVCLAVRVDGSESEPLRVCLYRCLCFRRLTFRVPLPLVP